MCCTGADASELGEVKTSKSFTVFFNFCFFCVKSRKSKNIKVAKHQQNFFNVSGLEETPGRKVAYF